MDQDVFIANSAEETTRFGERFAKSLKRGDVVALYGDLGSGKTTFVQGLAKDLDIKRRIISPTFIIVRQYKLGIRHKVLGIKYFYHIDLYRLENQNGIEGLGIHEILNDKNSIVAIEWAEKLGSLLPARRIDIRFEYVSDNQRRISISKIKY